MVHPSLMQFASPPLKSSLHVHQGTFDKPRVSRWLAITNSRPVWIQLRGGAYRSRSHEGHRLGLRWRWPLAACKAKGSRGQSLLLLS